MYYLDYIKSKTDDEELIKRVDSLVQKLSKRNNTVITKDWINRQLLHYATSSDEVLSVYPGDPIINIYFNNEFIVADLLNIPLNIGKVFVCSINKHTMVPTSYDMVRSIHIETNHTDLLKIEIITGVDNKPVIYRHDDYGCDMYIATIDNCVIINMITGNNKEEMIVN